MSRSTPKTPNVLPPPTASEAAFERVLRGFDAPASAVSPNAASAFVAQTFEKKNAYLERDAFAGIGDRDTFVTKVMGVSFEGRQNMVAGLLPGQELDVRRDADNPKDPNAVAVYFGTFHIGFLRKEIAKHLAPLMDGGARYRAVIEHVTGPRAGADDGKKFRGVNIRVDRVAVRKTDAFALQARAGADGAAIRNALIGDAVPHDAQEAVLARIESGKNTLAIFGTGRGKSFCFQYPAVMRALESEQKTLVLYPLRALANDQFDALTRRLDTFGLRILRANGSISGEERAALMQALDDGDWDLVLATPEFLQFHRAAFGGKSRPSLVVVDESHHIFESKHRAAYGRLRETIEALGGPQVLALTATADSDAFKQIVGDLRIDAWVIDPTVRENLKVTDARGTRDKAGYLRELFERSGGKGIVYCNSRTEATKTAETLHRTFGDQVLFYHAGMPSAERTQVEQYFRAGDLRIVVATSAFGEGIDLPDVRDVVLYHLNFDFTEFNQQAGRAGRDGRNAQIHLLFGEADKRINDFIIDRQAPTLPVLRALYKGMRHIAAGGELRMTFVDIARTLDLDKADERTVSTAVRIFEDEGLVESGIDDDGRFIRFVPVDGKVDMTQNERFAEGEAMRDDFARFSDFVLNAKAETLERIINRPIYPERVDLRH